MTSLFESCLGNSDFAEITICGETYEVFRFDNKENLFLLSNDELVFGVPESIAAELDPTEGIFEEVDLIISDSEGNSQTASAKIEFFICRNYLNSRHSL